jgi:hypothetical protein
MRPAFFISPSATRWPRMKWIHGLAAFATFFIFFSPKLSHFVVEWSGQRFVSSEFTAAPFRQSSGIAKYAVSEVR